MRILRWASRLWANLLLCIVLGLGLLLGLRALLPLLPLTPRPALTNFEPTADATNVAPRARVTMRFNTPMNPRSVERAVTIMPPAPVQWQWQDNFTTAVLSPTTTFQSDTNYTVQLADSAYNRLFRPLEASTVFRFRTAPSPVVLAVFPNNEAEDVSISSAISLIFSRPIVTEANIGRPVEQALLRFEPPLEGIATWVDPTTLLFQPAAPLRPGTRYSAMLEAGLSDSGGGQLNSPFTWSFSTPAPRILKTVPADGAERVAPRAPLAIHVSQPVDVAVLQQALVISPTIAGSFVASTLPDATQVITFTPQSGWQPEARYTAEIGANVLPVEGNLPLTPARWSFETAPQPALIGRFPGEGQLLPPNQDIRLIFNTAFEASALQSAISITPPVTAPVITTNGNEARISASLTAATVYTLTLPADLTDRNGVPLSREYQLRFLTAPAAPALEAPQAQNRVIRLLPGGDGPLLRRVNLSSLTADLYQLDEATVVRVLNFGEAEWRAFSPERYGQARLRSWTLQFNDPLNTQIEEPLELLDANGQPLGQGSYYLRLQTPEQTRTDLLVIISPTQLLLQRTENTIVVWAINAADGTSAPAQQITLYRDSTEVQRGQTGADGVWIAEEVVRGTSQVMVFSADRAVATAGASSAPSLIDSRQPQARLFTNGNAFYPGDTVILAGFARGADPSLNGRISSVVVKNRRTNAQIASTTLRLASTGVISTNLALPYNAAPGEYTVSLSLNGQTATTNFVVLPAPGPLLVSVSAPQLTIAGEDVPLQVSVVTAQGTPLSGATITWNLQAEVADPIGIDGYTTLSDQASAPQPSAPQLAQQTGSGQTGPDGNIAFQVSDNVRSAVPLRYVIQVQATEPGGPTAEASTSFTVVPSQLRVGARFTSSIVGVNQPQQLDIRVIDSDGAPRPTQQVEVEVFRRTWRSGDPQPQETQVLSRVATTDENGQAGLNLTLREGGEYRVRVFGDDAQGRRASTTLPLWVVAPRFNAWPPRDGNTATLVPDRAAYAPGETATILFAAPIRPGNALVTVRRGMRTEAFVQPIQASGVITVTVQPDDPPLLHVSAVLVEPGLPVSEPLRGAIALPVKQQEPKLTVTLAPNAAAYTTGSRATFTITTADQQGQGVPADVVVALFEANNTIPSSQADASPIPADNADNDAPFWNPNLRTDATGVLTVTLPLPHNPNDLQVRVWAADQASFGTAEQTIAITQPLILTLDAPDRMRVGDRFEIGGHVRNTSSVQQEVAVTLVSTGLQIQNGTHSQQVILAPGEEQTVHWPVEVQQVPRASLSINVRADGSPPLSTIASWTIQPAQAVIAERGGLLVDSTEIQQIGSSTPAISWSQLELSVSPSAQALSRDTITQLNIRAPRSHFDSAALLLSIPITHTTALTQTALAEILGGQNSDGGWGWWPSEASNVDTTAAALEALAEARRSGLTVPSRAVQRGLTWLEGATEPEAKQRARYLYIASRLGQRDDPALTRLAAAPAQSDVETLAYILLARPPNITRDQEVFEALLGKVTRDQRGVYVAGNESLTDTAITVLVARAIYHARPQAPTLAEMTPWLAAHIGLGEADSITTVRVAAVLEQTLPARESRSYTLVLNGEELLRVSSTIGLTKTTSLVLPASRLRATNTLTATTTGGPVLLRYNLAVEQHAPLRGPIRLLREYIDPQSGKPLSLDSIRVGQLVRVRITAILNKQERFITIDEPLPGGFAIVDSGRGDLMLAANGIEKITFARGILPAGVYQHSYLVRAVMPGTYAAPPTQATTLAGAPAGVGNTTTLTITP